MLDRAPSRGRYDRQSTASERAQEQRDLILHAVDEHLRRTSPSPNNLTISDVCKVTGLGRNTIYSHFESVDAACEYVIARALQALSEQTPKVSDTATPLDAVRSFSTNWLQTVAGHPSHYQIAVRWARDQLRERVRPHFRELIQLGISAGLFSQDPTGLRESLLLELLLATGSAVAADPSTEEAAAHLLPSLLTKACR